MAKNGEKIVTVTQWDTIKFAWVVSSQNAAENTSTIDWSLTLISGSVGRIDSTAAKSWSVTIDGQKFNGQNSVGIGNNSTLKLASGTAKIKHDAGGSKTFNFSFSQSFDIIFGGNKIGTVSGNGSGDLDAIYSVTTPKINTQSAEIGTSVTISVSNTNTSLTHDLFYKFGGLDWQKIASDVKGNFTWSIPMDMLNVITHTTSVAADIRCVTKSNGQSIGERSTSLTLTVPESVVPVISSVTVTEGTLSDFGVYVQGKSTINVKINAEGVYNSSIKSYSSEFETKIYKDAEWSSDIIRGTGDLEIKVTVTDTRGRTAEHTEKLTSSSYETPSIFSFNTVRCDASGTEKSDGEYVKIAYEYSVANLEGNNTAKAEIRYKLYSSGSYIETPIHTSTETSGHETGLVIKSVTFETDKNYDIKLTVTDGLGNVSERGDVLESDSVILDIKSDGTGISFFEFCDTEGVTIRGQIPRTPKDLSSGADLNDLTVSGYYTIPNSIMNSIQNKPSGTKSNGSAVVEVLNGRQTYRENYRGTQSWNDCKIWERLKTGPWACIYSGHGNLLWSGSDAMGEGVTIELSDSVANQPNGIVLVFSHHTGNYFYNNFFIPKSVIDGSLVTSFPSAANCSFILMSDGLFSSIGSKRINISNTKITGLASNTASGTAANTGITYNNNVFHLRWVIGV